MTLDEAIEHCEEVAKSSCSACGEDHKQLAEWLKELKQRRQEENGKILIDDAILENAFSALDYALSKTSDVKEKLKFFTPMIDIQKATMAFKSKQYCDNVEKAEEKKTCIIEWYDYSEKKPTKKGLYFVKLKDDPRTFSVESFDGTLPLDDVEFWAKSPRFPSKSHNCF